jgi:hypothetical protein
MQLSIERATELTWLPMLSEMTKETYEGKRMILAQQIAKARVLNDHRAIVILCSRFIDAFPQRGLQPIERAVREVFRNLRKEAKDQLTHICPVCGTTMYDQLCPIDMVRPICIKCGRTYTPMGYMDDDNYAKKWFAKLWDGGSEPSEVITL